MAPNEDTQHPGCPAWASNREPNATRCERILAALVKVPTSELEALAAHVERLAGWVRSLPAASGQVTWRAGDRVRHRESGREYTLRVGRDRVTEFTLDGIEWHVDGWFLDQEFERVERPIRPGDTLAPDDEIRVKFQGPERPTTVMVHLDIEPREPIIDDEIEPCKHGPCSLVAGHNGRHRSLSGPDGRWSEWGNPPREP